ncbi:ABC transporter ATP-binding protein [Parafrigoribacterium mesophilum]|uniref:ATP-binding cassette domain-containing protein n=1 Tax=Parafrigoribacterium mesophilum TaxID=433646 RepID=UPI0031FDF4BA
MTGLAVSRVDVRIDGTLLLDGVDCTAPAGSFSALIGPNGAGKSTLLRAIAAAQKTSAGTIDFDGDDLLGLPRRRRAQIVSLVEQDAATELALSVREVVTLGRTPYQSLWGDDSLGDRDIVEQSLAAAQMNAFADRDFTTLSGGERQRVLLAKALAQQPRLLLLDEPTNHLDISAQLATLRLLSSLAGTGVSVLAALHDLGLAAAASDHLIVLKRGRVILAGPTATILTPELILDVYGVHAIVIQHPNTGRPVIAFSPLG